LWRFGRRGSDLDPLTAGISPATPGAATSSALGMAWVSYRVLWFFLLFACLWFQPWYVVWLVALAPLLGSGRQVAMVILFSAVVHVKYLVFEFAWYWLDPRDVPLIPEVAATLLVFCPLLLCWVWQRWRWGSGTSDSGMPV
jgi:hypothetical protein